MKLLYVGFSPDILLQKEELGSSHLLNTYILQFSSGQSPQLVNKTGKFYTTKNRH